jgi:hypothetical protein
MIFAELNYEGDYGAVHDELLHYLRQTFNNVESGHQGDSWIWILDGEEKVAIDTFTSMKQLKIYDVPVLEGHENA